MALLLVTLSMFTVQILSEILNFDEQNWDPMTIECTDNSTDCVINCNSQFGCQYMEINCHRSAAIPCTINLIGGYSGQFSTIHTHQSPIIHLNVLGGTFYESTIYAHQRMGAKLYIFSNGTALNTMRDSYIYSPVGQGSLLSMRCGYHGCSNSFIYQDYTTEIYMESFGYDSFSNTQIRNIFDNSSSLNISRSDSNYIGINTAYRAPVFLKACDMESSNAFRSLNYYGHNHGNLTLYAAGSSAFSDAVIHATTDISASPYYIKLIGVPSSQVPNAILRYLTAIFSGLTLYSGKEANIYVDVSTAFALQDATIYARNANDVNIWVHDGADSSSLIVECPENNRNNTCKIFVDDTNGAFRRSMKIYTTNGYCVDGIISCVGGDSACDIWQSNIYCGYNQSLNYCAVTDGFPSGKFECINSGVGNCNNGYTEESCNAINNNELSPVAISETFEAMCGDHPTGQNISAATPAPNSNPNIFITSTATLTSNGIISTATKSTANTPSIGGDGEIEGQATTDASEMTTDGGMDPTSVIIIVVLLIIVFYLILALILLWKRKSKSTPKDTEKNVDMGASKMHMTDIASNSVVVQNTEINELDQSNSDKDELNEKDSNKDVDKPNVKEDSEKSHDSMYKTETPPDDGPVITVDGNTCSSPTGEKDHETPIGEC